MQKIYGKKIKNYSLVKLWKQENIRRQVGNIISLPLIPGNEINNSMQKKLLKNYVMLTVSLTN